MVKFANPTYIWTFGLIVVILVLIIYNRRKWSRNMAVFAGEALTEKVLEGYRHKWKRWKERLLVLTLICLALALIGPQVGKKLTKVKRKGIDIIIAFDTSISMNASDISPRRLERAKYEVGKFIDNLHGDRIGVIAFAGISYLVCPLTMDYNAVELFMEAVDTDIIGVQGTAIAAAITRALGAFEAGTKKHKALIVISDGEDHEGDIKTAVQKAAAEGVIIYSVGVGTYSGAPIPVQGKPGETKFKRDRSGKVVTTTLEEATLQQIAAATGGKYYRMQGEPRVFDKIYQDILQMEQKEIRSHQYSDYRTQYQPFLLIGIVFFLASIVVSERKLSQQAPKRS